MPEPSIFQRIIDWLKSLFANAPGPNPVCQPENPLVPDALVAADVPAAPVTIKVSLIILNPILPSQRYRRLTEVLAWNDPNRMVADFIEDLRAASHGYANYQVVERIIVDDFPVKADGFAYSGEEYLKCFREQNGFHSPDEIDYYRLLYDYDLQRKVKDGEIDEVWTVGFPWAGFAESRMAGPSAFWCNSYPLEGTAGSERRYIIMGFSYERGQGEMLESYGHRVESIMEQVYRKLPEADPANFWKRFIRYDLSHPGRAEVGNIHFAPNSRRDYDWGCAAPVASRCRTWDTFPDLTGEPVMVACEEWGGGDMRAHHLWWLSRLPHAAGATAGVAHNWWAYITNPNLVKG